MTIHKSNPSTWSWPEVAFLSGMVFVGFWLVWLELAVRVGGL